MSTQRRLNEVTRLVQDLNDEVSGLPEPMASTALEGATMSHEILGRYLPNFACLLTGIALGDACKSLHTRWQATQSAMAMYGLAPELRGSADSGQSPGE